VHILVNNLQHTEIKYIMFVRQFDGLLNRRFMEYSIKQLQTQKSLISDRITADKAYIKHVMTADFKLAIEYGEGIRISHIKTAQNRINTNERKILELTFKIQDMEEVNNG
jgi:hypothetical protein